MRAVKFKNIPLVIIFAMSLFFMSGCEFDWKSLADSGKNHEMPLMYVEISFSENEHLTGYVKTLGLEKEVKILVGGASVNNLYDKSGNVIATFNYAKVNYIKLLTEP